ncbi:M24 family metallopeptidase [Oscillatoria sp. FACHB-1407]|uniref:M24 family metallopeptidase n=1 Tax=Oscillatoria sp. FACHB-1407 TaxID=2692847 RepID=UPI0016822ECC|nr:M24 family metallopeptidase [Oscillatoria sp. FACHB-1407]MBD2459555.1 M24 family metallopeptidase [Oscillatoria sp. FACHB-1407]
MNRSEEISFKLERMRQALQDTQAAGIWLRGIDWFAWATAGGSNMVLLAAETGVAEVLVTATDAWILTNEIEAQRLKDEELPDEGSPYKLFVHPWADSSKQETFVREATGDGKVLTDRPTSNESALPPSLIQQKRIMLPSELDRYREVGRLASEAMTEVMLKAQPDWTEYQLAGAGAEALWARGLHPALTLVAGDRRLPIYRHPLPTQEPIGRQAMLVFCARGYGLYANLTRFVCFGSLSSDEANLHHSVGQVEAALLNACKVGTPLSQVYEAIAQAYDKQGYPNAIREHHQGGTTGYLSREAIANPTASDVLAANTVMAWNPSLPGAKIEDTFVLLEDGRLENLTVDPNWQTAEIEGRLRPLPLER